MKTINTLLEHRFKPALLLLLGTMVKQVIQCKISKIALQVDGVHLQAKA